MLARLRQAVAQPQPPVRRHDVPQHQRLLAILHTLLHPLQVCQQRLPLQNETLTQNPLHRRRILRWRVARVRHRRQQLHAVAVDLFFQLLPQEEVDRMQAARAVDVHQQQRAHSRLPATVQLHRVHVRHQTPQKLRLHANHTLAVSRRQNSKVPREKVDPECRVRNVLVHPGELFPVHVNVLLRHVLEHSLIECILVRAAQIQTHEFLRRQCMTRVH
eukprot:2330866-Rhodomonas_salina.1